MEEFDGKERKVSVITKDDKGNVIEAQELGPKDGTHFHNLVLNENDDFNNAIVVVKNEKG